MIIGISGFIGSGKDTIADYLVNHHEFRRESFANTLKDSVSVIFGWDRLMLEGRTKSSREWREQVDSWWANRLNIPELTPRWVLQHIGTDVLRNHFHDNIWVASLENKLRKTKDNVVISDVRFPNEILAIKNSGGICVRVKRGPEPKWYDTAADYNKGPNGNIGWALGQRRLEKAKIHPSEYSWVGSKFDHIITNDSTIDNLQEQIKNLL
jgi:hypothetical protein